MDHAAPQQPIMDSRTKQYNIRSLRTQSPGAKYILQEPRRVSRNKSNRVQTTSCSTMRRDKVLKSRVLQPKNSLNVTTVEEDPCRRLVSPSSTGSRRCFDFTKRTPPAVSSVKKTKQFLTPTHDEIENHDPRNQSLSIVISPEVNECGLVTPSPANSRRVHFDKLITPKSSKSSRSLTPLVSVLKQSPRYSPHHTGSSTDSRLNTSERLPAARNVSAKSKSLLTSGPSRIRTDTKKKVQQKISPRQRSGRIGLDGTSNTPSVQLMRSTASSRARRTTPAKNYGSIEKQRRSSGSKERSRGVQKQKKKIAVSASTEKASHKEQRITTLDHRSPDQVTTLPQITMSLCDEFEQEENETCLQIVERKEMNSIARNDVEEVIDCLRDITLDSNVNESYDSIGPEILNRDQIIPYHGKFSTSHDLDRCENPVALTLRNEEAALRKLKFEQKNHANVHFGGPLSAFSKPMSC